MTTIQGADNYFEDGAVVLNEEQRQHFLSNKKSNQYAYLLKENDSGRNS